MQDHQAETSYCPERVASRSRDMIVLTGCSGGGKSTLLSALSRKGASVFEEPGRQVVREQIFVNGDALPWKDLGLFVDLTISRSIYHMIEACRRPDRAFFDRGIIDQIAGLQVAGIDVPEFHMRAAERFRYRRQVFVLPPWPEIFHNDGERRHAFEDALKNYEGLLHTYRQFGYDLLEVPKETVEMRAEFIIAHLADDDPEQSLRF
ncbi:AAA family ATPase [Rhizobium sp. CG5]|uniref:AAA family ATPase n=1 Tax=Rhizobium sp. CG5 TaxID=2726076 RepID=UPI0020340811|nr:AAA family ATPase [Rhizobium sp. CG5]MCM2473792.1 AAA family ATPase [Rhizobium sp. CG5]